ncbi:sigma-70 family RNA polymerase sigma factor [Streptomyces sp. MBT42]|uniref:sigma-70 family RNA polymerase sigma factor n=1 Tax=Streptomyces sp. MBT42 TaxID=1488373 RepID=UPI001E61EB3E|nr:sigma-70 family RNA polymerase sigma factor [Streptomyces sp. MBT42]MCD2463765.1 sigma-70 family RNA polymerase sigma factor [Streptomyces sp. MBT42]
MGEESIEMAERHLIESELPSVIARLKSCASRSGAVSWQAFTLEANRLGLSTDEERRGLRAGLAAMGIRVKANRDQATSRALPAWRAEQRVAAPSDAVWVHPPAASDSGRVPSPAVRRLAEAKRMLSRYADSRGTVSKLAHDGAVRLHGLSPAEARELTADFPITRPGPLGTATVQAAQVPAVGAGRKKQGSFALSAEYGIHAEAVVAARGVLEADRWRRDRLAEALKADEEVGLAVLLRGGEGALSRVVTEEEAAALPCGGERRRAYECLVLHNQRLVRQIAQRHLGRGLVLDDLVQHGSMGLLRAVRGFDATLGYKFSTYAAACIEKAITQAIADEVPLVRLPPELRERAGKVARTERRLLTEGRARTLENVAFLSGLTFAEVEEVFRARRPAGPSRRRRRSTP